MCVICLKNTCDLGLGAPAVGLETLGPLPLMAANPPETVPDAAAWSALDMGVSWHDFGLPAGGTLTYTVTDSVGAYTSGFYSGLNELDDYRDLSDAGEAIVREALEMWDAVIDIEMADPADTPDPGDDAVRPELQAGGSTVLATAWAYGPGTWEVSGDIWFNVSAHFLSRLVGDGGPYRGTYEAVTALHEVGHALGLKHPHDGAVVLDPAFDGLEYTVMSYRSHVGASIGGYRVAEGSYPQSLMMLDIAMAQAHYGADFATLAGDTVYTFDTATGEMFVDGAGQGAGVANKVFRTLWDGDGTDLIDLSNYATDLAIDLRPGHGIDLDVGGTAQRALLDRFGGVYAPLHVSMSLLHEGDTRSLIENANGGSGADVFIGNVAANVFDGGAGADAFTGGLGADTFVFGAGADTLADTLAGLDGDVVADFDAKEDSVIVEGVTLAAQAVTYDAATGFLDIDADGDGTLEARIAIGTGLGEVAVAASAADTTISLAEPLAKPPPETVPAEGLLIDGEYLPVLDGMVTRNDFGTYALSADGRAITVADNGWKVVEMPVTITSETVLSFEFSAETLGEIQGIGFASGDDPAPDSFFQLAGSQSPWGIQAHNDYTVGSGSRSYEIAVGDYLAGQSFDRLVLVADDDAAAAGDSRFERISLSNTSSPPEDLLIDGEYLPVLDGMVTRNDFGTYALSADGRAITVADNGWKVVEMPVTITSETVLSFEFSAETLGEIQGIGFASGDDPAPDSFFQLAGSQSPWGIQAHNDYTVGSGSRSYEIAVGDYLAGQSFDRLVFVADDDAAAAGDSTFANVDLA